MYENTGVRAHVMAAELIDAGVDVHGIYRRLYEGMPYAKLELLARALAHVQRYDERPADLHAPHARRLPRCRAPRTATPRASSTTCARSRARRSPRWRASWPEGSRGRRKVSLRATDGRVDVSVIARAGGGGGHRQAAGFATEMSEEDLVGFLREQVAAQL